VASLAAVPPGEVTGDPPAPVLVRGVIGPADRELLERGEVRLDGVEPTGVGRGVDRLDVVRGHERPQTDVLVGAQVIHHDREPGGQRIAGPQPREDGEQVLHRLALAHLGDEAVGMDVVEGVDLLGALEPAVGGPEALGTADRRPASSGQRSQLERSTLVETDDRPVLRTALVEVEDAVFFASNSESGDSFQVLVR
jgi:hypothetical protein